MAIAAINYIDVDQNGVARVAGSRSKVIQIVMDTMNGLEPPEIHANYPHLSLAQIHAALAYHHDHKDNMDAQIRASLAAAEQARRDAGESPVAKRLRGQGLVP